jgi:hypothetical protein
MSDCGDYYEYIAMYADDLLIASGNPQPIIHELENTHQFHLKATGSIEYHLGCNFFCDPKDTTLC